MRVQSLLPAFLLPIALAAPLSGWTETVTKTVSWFGGPGSGPLPELVMNGIIADPDTSIYEVLKSRDEFSKLCKLIDEDREVVNMLNDKKQCLTLFAPNNEAIDKFLTRDDLPHMKEDRKRQLIKASLKYHVIQQDIEYSRLGQNSTYATALRADDGSFDGQKRRLRVESNRRTPLKVTINNYAVVTQSDIRAANGVIHKVDSPIIMPFDIMDIVYLFPRRFSATATALLKIDLQNQYEFDSGHFPDKNGRNDRSGKGRGATTLFVPTNEAWNNLPQDLVLYLFSPFGERTLRKLMQYHTIPRSLVYSEWVKSDRSNHKDESVCAVDRDLSFEWDRHFDTLIDQKLPVYSKKSKASGSNEYNIQFEVHGIPVEMKDNPGQNGAVHIINHVICPRNEQGEDEGTNAKNWSEWKDWLFDWTKKVEASD